jgi:hypothetical protein
MKKLLTVALTASLCLSSFTLFGCVDPHLGTDPETTAAIISESTAETTENVTEREEPVIIRVPVSAEVLEVRGDGLYKIIMRKPYYETGDENDFYDKEMLLRTTDIEPCVGDRITFTYKGLTDEIIDGLPVCKTSKVEFFDTENMTDKPVIYLYPEAPTSVSVKLTLKGRLTCTYPDYDKGWQDFTAHPDGTLIFPDGKEYYCLYWEGIQDTVWDFSKGFCVKGSDTAAFLEWALAEQGLTPREANEFIIYWLPLMQNNPYNVISFQTDAYTDTAVLEITPTPDSLLRVMMAYYPSDEAVEIAPQELAGFERDGFTVVEWGGSLVKKP